MVQVNPFADSIRRAERLRFILKNEAQESVEPSLKQKTDTIAHRLILAADMSDRSPGPEACGIALSTKCTLVGRQLGG